MFSDSPHEECGVFGIYAPDEDVARITFFSLYALQHRGQESAGIAVSDGKTINTHKEMGLVSQIFDERSLRHLKGHIAIGHTRYSTTGSSQVINAQPFTMHTLLGPLAVGHNGNLTNAGSLRRQLMERGVGLMTSSDSEVATMLLAGLEGNTWSQRIDAFTNCVEGAYCLTVLTRDALYAVRDPWGLRPLCLGRFGDAGWVVASESCAFDTIGAEFIREIDPGEVVQIDRDGPRTIAKHPAPQQAFCLFEYIYFSRPDSFLQNQLIHEVRMRLGHELAREAPADADVVIGVPDSALPAALGFSQASGIPYGDGLIKNRYIGRTFIQPDQRLRQQGVALKLNPLPNVLAGKRVILIDDTIVRGTTSGPIIKLLRKAGATEVHMRVSAPPIRHPCFMGVDMATQPELIAFNKTEAEICESIGADSLAYLSMEGLIRATRRDANGFCGACFTGKYPFPILEAGKEIFELTSV
ncbi:amidophosphoribosyltransferase [Herpetosiphon giganteus]|uniref:amidophosphoribosyltransferase n=1 Tax=Herpetosiphon giganteus TaxID=2029754 RepID=UPI00195C2BF8|nr:amidophosphoribosyltransferase [Herpetosiphon giganteus]MBM7843376.1 amidophosphoribosyltransferase [Herpetosiphon giganteus]